MRTHYIKLDIEYCDAVFSGEKPFEIRWNDREYQKGDRIKFDPREGSYRADHPIWEKEYEITYVLSCFGLQDGFVALGIQEVQEEGEMNREILFRGKREDNGEWVEGLPLYGNIGNEITEIQSRKTKSGKDCEDKDWYLNDGEIVPIILQTLGQYIGKVDINGKKIFEGDILLINHREWSVEEREIVEVKWCGNEGYPAFDIPKSSTSGECNGLSLINNCEDYSVEIIGNIYDNPELLEAQP